VLLKIGVLFENLVNCFISYLEDCEKSLFDVFKPCNKTLMVLGNGEIKISTFGAFLTKIRVKNTPNGFSRSVGARTGALGAQLQRVSVGHSKSGARRPRQSKNLLACYFGCLGGNTYSP
jgi:hypothetical protein